MKLKNKLVYSGIISAAFLVTSIILPLIPCRIAPRVPNPLYSWTLCSLNPDLLISLNSLKEYWGLTTGLTEAYFITLFIGFLFPMVFLHFFSSGRRRK